MDICEKCTNASCPAGQYRTGSCNDEVGDGFKCNMCLDDCPSGQFRDSCGGTSVGKCSPCLNPLPKNAAYSTSGGVQLGICEWRCGSYFFREGESCTSCSRQVCAAGTYRTGACDDENGDGFVCTPCPSACPVGQYPSGCGGTSPGFCTPCTNKPSNEFEYIGAGIENDCNYRCKSVPCNEGDEFYHDACKCLPRRSCPAGFIQRCGDARFVNYPCSMILSLSQEIHPGCRCESLQVTCPPMYTIDPNNSYNRSMRRKRRIRRHLSGPGRISNYDPYECSGVRRSAVIQLATGQNCLGPTYYDLHNDDRRQR